MSMCVLEQVYVVPANAEATCRIFLAASSLCKSRQVRFSHRRLRIQSFHRTFEGPELQTFRSKSIPNFLRPADLQCLYRLNKQRSGRWLFFGSS